MTAFSPFTVPLSEGNRYSDEFGTFLISTDT